MFRWRFIKQFPKFALVIGVIVLSTGLFWFWWRFQYPWTSGTESVVDTQEREKVEAVAVTLPSMEGNLLLADGDLYELNSGKLLVADWFNDPMPTKLFLDRDNKRVIGLYDKGLARFALNGEREAAIGGNYGVALNPSLTLALFVRDGDIWKAGIDFNEFKLVNEERVTSTTGFMDRFFVENIITGTDNMLIQRNMNQVVRINLATGEVVTMGTALSGMRSLRSPDGGLMLGAVSEMRAHKLSIYDVATDETKLIDLSAKFPPSKFFWLSKERCAFLQGLTELGVYERPSETVRQVVSLPFQCQEISKPSPSGRFVFCSSFKGVVLVDVESGELEVISNPGDAYEWIDGETLLVARDVPDTALRGTWLKKLGQEEVRVSTEPYIFSRNGASSVLGIPEAEMVFFASRGGMFKMKSGAVQAEMFAPLAKPLTRFVYLEKWAH